MCFLNGGCFTLQKRQLFWRHGHSFLRLRRACSITIYLFSRVFFSFSPLSPNSSAEYMEKFVKKFPILQWSCIYSTGTCKILLDSSIFCKLLQNFARFYWYIKQACCITVYSFSRVFSRILLFLLICLRILQQNL